MQKTLIISLTATLFTGYFCGMLIDAIFPFLDVPFALLWTAIFYEFLKTKVYLTLMSLTLPRVGIELARKIIPMAFLTLQPVGRNSPELILTLTLGACAIAYSVILLSCYALHKKLKNNGVYKRIPYNFGGAS